MLFLLSFVSKSLPWFYFILLTYIQVEGSMISGQLLKPRPAGSPPDMAPFFLRQYVKTHANNVFEDYPLLLMEIILRLPYQVALTPLT